MQRCGVLLKILLLLFGRWWYWPRYGTGCNKLKNPNLAARAMKTMNQLSNFML
jgi:hypothetical protein